MRNVICYIIMIGVITLVGCGKDKDKNEDSAAKNAGAKVGEAVTEFATGMGKGIDKKMTVNAELSAGLKEKGISMTIAKGSGLDHASKGISVYLIAAKPLKAKLIAKAMNEAGQEIGRSVVDVNFVADDAKYIIFKFHEEMDTQLVKKYFIDIKSILTDEPVDKAKKV